VTLTVIGNPSISVWSWLRIRLDDISALSANPSVFLGSFVMIQEMTRSHYWGVLCSRCKERIPVPKRVQRDAEFFAA
jgi:hypothetical protein